MALSVEEARVLAQPWMAPIRADAPAGAPAKELPVYQRLVGEVGKLESPAAGAVSWSNVLEDGSELLRSHSKDLLVAAYVSFALHATQGLRGFLSGVALLTELIDTYWLSLFPEPAR